MSTLKRHDGELEIDCRAGGGLPEDIANQAGLPRIRDGAIYHCATMTCTHCATAVIVNELRVRPREYCRTCDGYVCDYCARTRAEAGAAYVHRSFKELADLVRSGNYTLQGPASAPILVPVLKET